MRCSRKNPKRVKGGSCFFATLAGHNTKSKRFAAVHSPQHLEHIATENWLLVLLLGIFTLQMTPWSVSGLNQSISLNTSLQPAANKLLSHQFPFQVVIWINWLLAMQSLSLEKYIHSLRCWASNLWRRQHRSYPHSENTLPYPGPGWGMVPWHQRRCLGINLGTFHQTCITSHTRFIPRYTF